MRRTRRHSRVEMGESISFEDVLTVMTVLLLLRLVFMVPLVNLDKAKTVAARGDEYWIHQLNWILSHKADSSQIKPYKTAFGLGERGALLTESEMGRTLYLESVAMDSNLTVLQHNLEDSSFIAMSVLGRGHSRSFRRGKLLWSKDEAEWFPASDSVDYGARSDSKEMEKKFRAWTRTHRGY